MKRIIKTILELLVLMGLFSGVPLIVVASDLHAEVTLTIAQSFGDHEPSPLVDSGFQYRLLALDEDGPLPQESSCQLSGTSETEIGPLVFTRSGIYHYRLAIEKEPTGAYLTCDRKQYFITIQVKDEATGSMTSMIIQNESGEKVSSILFRHHYQAVATDPKQMVDPLIRKKITGSPKKQQTFQFVLTAANPKTPMPDGSQKGTKEVEINGSGETAFGTWSYAETGTFYYTISERSMDLEDYRFDQTVYTITDQVADVGGQLALTRTVSTSDQKTVTSCLFVNDYLGSNILRFPKSGDRSRNAWNALGVLVLVAVYFWDRWRRRSVDHPDT